MSLSSPTRRSSITRMWQSSPSTDIRATRSTWSSAIVKQASCPAIVDPDTDDEAFIDKAARRGIFAYVRHGKQRGLANTIDIVLNRYAEFSRVHGALRTGAIIEQTKGILMERHGINADEAFAELRGRARNTNESVLEVAQAVTDSYPLFRPRPIDADWMIRRPRPARRGSVEDEQLAPQRFARLVVARAAA